MVSPGGATEISPVDMHQFATMNRKGKKSSKRLSQEDVDKSVVEQANDDSAWEKPIQVQRTKAGSFSLSADLVARTAFLAQLHRETNLEDWITRIVRERVELEERAFGQAKRELITKITA